MPDLATLRRRPGRGTIVLLGGSSGTWPPTAAVDRAAIAAITRDGPAVFLPAAGCGPDYGASFIAQYEALGSPAGAVAEVRDAASAADPANVALITSASLVYIGGGDSRLLLSTLHDSPALAALGHAHDAGAVIVGMSAGAMALAGWGVSMSAEIGLLPGWGWLPEAVVSVHYTPERRRRLEEAVAAHPDRLGLGLPEHVALAFGPASEPQVWGDGTIDVVSAPATDA